MKIRSDFVTNSSSSSFIAMKFESDTLVDIFERFKTEIKNDKEKYYPCSNFYVDDGMVEYREDESGYWDDGPENLREALNILLQLFYHWGEDTLQIEKKETDNEKVDLSKYDTEETAVRHKIAKEIFENRNKIMEDMQFAEVVTGSVGWGGDDDTRYYPDSYDEETLKEIYETIAENKDIPIEEITEEDFGEYVGDFMSVDENTYTFTRKNGKGKNKIENRYYLEG